MFNPRAQEAVMSATVAQELAELRRANAELLRERDAALTALAQRNTEYGERIEHQSATIDVLKAMSASPGDAQPVFDLIANRARAFCEADGAMVTLLEDGMLHLRIHIGATQTASAAYEAYFPCPVDDSTTLGRAVLTRAPVHNPDLLADPGYRMKAITSVNLVRSNAAVPILRGGVPIGAIGINWLSVGQFPTAQLELLKTFAEQAVIAITSAETYRALQTRTNDLQESLEYQTATSDVLKVISRSTFDLQPVLDTVAQTAARLCDADQAAIYRREGESARLVANFGFPPEYETYTRALGAFPIDPNAAAVGQRTLVEGRPVHVHDVTAVPGYWEIAITLGKQRTSLGVPLLRDGETIGNIMLARQRVAPFTDRQIELVSTFADQAVIAMENARLLTEQREALEQQTATAEVLQVINASPGNLAPVFEAMLDRAMRLCEGAQGTLWMFNGQQMRATATAGYSRELAAQLNEWREIHPFQRRLLQGERVFQIIDLAAEELYRSGNALTKAAVDVAGIRTVVFVGLVKDATTLGGFTIGKHEIRAFTDKQIALLQNFAAQAVIAMENTRLLTEQRDALEQQTATAEVLQVINSSPGELVPVFDAMLEKAIRLCGASFGILRTIEGGRFHGAASRGVPGAYAEFSAHNPQQPQPGSIGARILDGEPVVHVMDVADDEAHQLSDPHRRALVELGGARTSLVVPMKKDSVVLGAIQLYRQHVQAFSDKQIALLQNFAAQAVIAMENARLLTETREALDQQTATSEVLQVINASPGDLKPVFDVILERALDLCEANCGNITIKDGEAFHFVAAAGHAEFDEWLRLNGPARPGPGTTMERMMRGEQVVHVTDIADDDVYRTGSPVRTALVEVGGFHTFLGVALRKDDALLGILHIYRQEVRPFSEKQIALLQSFAAQAVIAMGNARLLDELRQRQEELRVTFENMGDGVALFDETRHLAASNSRFREMLNVPDDVISSRPTFADYIRYLADRGEYGPNPEEHVQHLLAFGDQPMAFERTRPNGRILEIRGNPVPGGGFVVIYSDITERKRNEEELRAARDAAEEASRTIEAAYRDLKAAQASLIQAEKMASLGQLTAGIAHEIKNPLNFVNNFASLSVDLLDELKQTAAPGLAMLDEARRSEVDELTNTLASNLEKINEHGRRADGIVRGMLEHSRGSSGERRSVELNALVDEALNLAYHGARAQDQSFNVTLQRELGQGIAPITLAPQDVTRVLLNLFSNGFYAARDRQRTEAARGFEPTLQVSTRDTVGAVEIRVRDNGIGIRAEIKDRLFQPFFTTKPPGEGTGLGLSMSYDIITQQHGGTISVDSRVGEYSEFTVRLPRSS
jgi:GAF domain-containing protein/nitrogen-specific signal transduction histidine kinase